jgi:methionine-rich copper-binding protein CopC
MQATDRSNGIAARPPGRPRGAGRAGRARCVAWSAVTAFVVMCATGGPAFAHAFLDRAVPAVGSSVHAPPREVRLKFTEPLEPAFSSVRVVDRAGKGADRGDAHVDSGDASVLIVSLPPLAPGKYRVVWRVVSVDTHVTEGDFTFDVAP